jgi:hypothetical protein
MSRTSCPQEEAILKAARAGELPEDFASHALRCAVCREIVQTARWMQSLAQGAVAGAALHDARLVWWNAQLADRRAKAEKTRTVLEWLEVFPGAIVPVVLAGWVAWNWFAIQGQATRLIGEWLPQFWAAFALASLAPALLCLAAIFLAYPLLVGE